MQRLRRFTDRVRHVTGGWGTTLAHRRPAAALRPHLSSLAVAGLALLAACTSQTGQAPTVSSIADQSTAMGEPLDVPFTVTDESPDFLAFTIASSAPSLIAPNDVTVLGAGTDRTLHIQPAPDQTGTAELTLTVQDVDGRSASEPFDVEVHLPYSVAFPRLLASDAGDGDEFGWSLAIDGDILVIGAHRNDHENAQPDPLQDAGTAYVFRHVAGAWTPFAMLTAPSPAANDLFGASVAVSGNTIVVGAPGADIAADGAGAAFVYRVGAGGVTYLKTLTASNAAAGDSFGSAVALEGILLAVGAPGQNDPVDSAGAVVLFSGYQDAWEEEMILTANDAEPFDFLGMSVAVEYVDAGTLTVVAGTGAESVYVFAHDGMTISQQDQLTPSGGTGNESFGRTVDVDGATIIVGADNASDETGTLDAAGAAYVFERSGTTWTEVEKLFAPTPQLFARFGMSVAVHGEYALVGENIVYPGDEPIANAYVFRREASGWEHTTTLDSTDPNEGTRFGRMVALDAGHAVVSDLNAMAGADAVGAVYVYGR
jgi:hypothetical protein